MSRMKFFDPACGSGNFLIITYKCLRFLEMDVLALQRKCTPEGEILFVDNSVISLSQFYGIELLDFPHEVAMLSLWLAEHQMNTKLNEDCGVNTKALPLKNITQIVCGNACRIDWNEVCPHTPEEEVFIFGNPPYLGSSMQNDEQKADLEHVCGKFQNYKNLDYIANWFYLGTLYIKGCKAKCAFVSTNSICQGDSVALLWPNVFDKGVEINFAYQSFKWTNNAKYNATVMVVIIGLSCISKEEKLLYNSNGQCTKCGHINAYLLDGPNIIINRIGSSISNLPEMVFGNKPTDGGFLILDQRERDSILNEYPQAERIIKKYHGADSFLYGDIRFCLWITEKDVSLAYSIPPIKTRLDKVRDFRLKSKAESTVLYADRPYLFKQRAHKDTDSIIVPRVTSERRQYLPVGLLNEDTIISDAAQAIYDANIFIIGILCSHIHVVWLSAIGGKLETRYRYSSLVYNSFPFPKISAEKKQEIESAAENVLITREYYPEKTLAELYDPDKMPQDLREAHAKLDDIVESCYPGYPFASDEARLECLFKLYEKMTAKK
jgi:type II restriction/modification system DNA methylase subunit YeeA